MNASTNAAPPVTHHRTAEIDGVTVFYREAGPADAPVVLLLHGFPTSSHMFRNLMPYLADRYHVIAPDYPGFGQSDSPDRCNLPYTFDRLRRAGRRASRPPRYRSLRDVPHGLRRSGRMAPRA